MYKVDRCLADPLLPIRVGLTQKSSKKEPTGESSAVHTWAKTTDFRSGTRTDFRYSGFLLSVAKSRFMIKSAKFLWCSTFA